MNTVEYIVLIILMLFSTFATVSQIKCPLKKILNKLDSIGILPNWSFFAPIPGTKDYRMLYRDYFSYESFSDWNEVDLKFKSDKLLASLWNPDKHYQKGIIDLIEALKSEQSQLNNKKLIQFSWPYLVLLQIIMNEPISGGVKSRQFLLLNSSNFDIHRDLEPIFISTPHRLS